MADRLRKILDNDKERSKVLKCESKADWFLLTAFGNLELE